MRGRAWTATSNSMLFPGTISADVHEIFDVLVNRGQSENAPEVAGLIGVDDVAANAADALEHVDGGIMTAIGQRTAQPDMSVHDPLDGVGDGLVEIVALDQDGVEPGDGSALAPAGPLENLRKQ